MVRFAPPMIRAVPRSGVRRSMAAALGAVLVTAALGTGRAGAADEVRALWVVRTMLASPAAIDRMVDSAAAAGFNTLIVQVRGRGDSYFSAGLDPRPALLADDASFDPLQTTIDRAHQRGLRVHAWINVNLVSSANELPASRSHVVYRHPE